MSHVRALLARIAGLLTGPRADDDLHEELQSHMEMETAENIRRGMAPDEARRQALLASGGLTQAAEEVRDRRGIPWIESALADLHYAVRALRHNPGFTAVVVITLALGIGSSTAVFTLANGVLWRALPYRDAGSLVLIRGGVLEGPIPVSEQEASRYRLETRLFDAQGSYRLGTATLTGGSDAEPVRVAAIDAQVLPTLGVAPLLGRSFTAAEDVFHGPAVALLSYELWQRRFGGSPTAMGASVAVDGSPMSVIGVLPPHFRLPTNTLGAVIGLYVPLGLSQSPDPRNLHYLTVVARLHRGLNLAQAGRGLAEVATLVRQEITTLPASFTATVTPVREEMAGSVRPILIALLAAVGLVLLIACVNVSNLLLVRSDARRRELAVRVALGAGRGRLIRQLLTESGVLGLGGGTLGLGLAALASSLFVAGSPPNVPRLDQVGIDAPVFLFTLAISLVAVCLFGLLPAFRGTSGLFGGLRDGGHASPGRRSSRVYRGLVVVEVSLAVMLAISAGLLVRSLIRLQHVPTGFSAPQSLTLRISTPPPRYADVQSVRGFYQTVLDGVRTLPGVVSAGAVSRLPLADVPGDWGITIEGRAGEILPSGRPPWADLVVITDGYIEALGATLIEGRPLAATDDSHAVPVVLINETMARRYWPNGSPLGARFRVALMVDTVFRTVAGVVADIRQAGLDAPVRPTMYLPHAQFPMGPGGPMATMSLSTMNLVVRTSTDPLGLVSAVRGVVRQVDPDIPTSGVRSLTDVESTSTWLQQFDAALFTIFAIVSLVLVSVGVYGVMAAAVTRRQREMAIRLALGAPPHLVLGMIVREGMHLALIGVLLGLGAALLGSRILARLLFNVGIHDPPTYVAITILVSIIALAACAMPALRATRVDPVRALRAE